jgi:uncharacterized protein YdhG (YjbR/CyaY superfamily)
MPVSKPKNKAVSAFIRKYPANTRKILEKMRETIRKAAPDAEETISYMIPAYKQNRTLVYFSGFKDHIGFFPTSSGIRAFKKELSGYAVSKGTAHFPLDKPVPWGLIRKIVKFRVKENSIKKKP